MKDFIKYAKKREEKIIQSKLDDDDLIDYETLKRYWKDYIKSLLPVVSRYEPIKLNNKIMNKQEIEALAELLMQSDSLGASVIMLNDFADKCWQEGAVYAQNDAAKEIREHYVDGR